MRLAESLARRPLLGALLFEGAFIPIALLLALLLGVEPWARLELSLAAIMAGLLASLPLMALLGLLFFSGFGWVRRIESDVQRTLQALFTGLRPGGVVALSLVAGLAEELLFRGVLQVWLAQSLDLAIAVSLAALLFGLAHFVSPAYFLLATLMGVYFGVLFELSGNLLVPALAHAFYDWAAIRYYLGRAASAALR